MLLRRHRGLFGLLVLPLWIASCSDGGGGGDPDLKYVAEIEDEGSRCEIEVEYINRDGNRRTLRDQSAPWSYQFHQSDGAHLYLAVSPECDRALAELYIDGHRVAHDSSTYKAEIDGYLRVDSAGNAWFDPS